MEPKDCKFSTLMSREYQMKYEPSADKMNAHFKVIEHKTRAPLHQLAERDRYRRSLSALLNSRAPDPLLDKNHSALNTLHQHEQHWQGKVSQAAPTKDHQQFAALRQGRDPRMNEANAHFDHWQAQLNKENYSYNMGRHPTMERPSSAILKWRPRTPFLTYEKAGETHAQQQRDMTKRLHAKIMNDRIMQNNQKCVPEHLLPLGGLAWVPEKPAQRQRRSRSQEQAQTAVAPQTDQKPQAVAKKVENNKDEEAVESIQNVSEAAAELARRPPAQIMKQLKTSNVKDMVLSMTVHEQLRMLRNIIEDEEFKLQERTKQAKTLQKVLVNEEAQQQPRQVRKRKQSKENDAECRCEEIKRLDDLTYSELENQKPAQAIEIAANEPQVMPLTAKNLSSLDESAKAKWTVRSQAPSEPMQVDEDKIVDTGVTTSPIKSALKKPKHERVQSKEKTHVKNLDLSKVVNTTTVRDRLRGWIQPNQMDGGEIMSRQSYNPQTDKLAKRIVEIASINGMVAEVPPVPRYVMGTHMH